MITALSGPTLLLILALGTRSADPTAAWSPPLHTAENVKITILSTNLADRGLAEWGFSALVEVDGRCILFDTGRYPQTVLRNAEILAVDLSCVTDVVLSHFHSDHIGGVLTLQEAVRGENSDAFARVHVASGFHLTRRRANGAIYTDHIKTTDALRAAGISVIEHAAPAEIFPGVWITGPISRPHPEKNYNQSIEMLVDGSFVEDNVPDDQALTILTERGHVVLLGCGHAGTINTLEYIRTAVSTAPIHAAIGGLHLYAADDSTLAWTAEHLASMEVGHLMGGHCTGIEALIRLREGANLRRETAVVAAVGASFTLEDGIDPGSIAQ